MKKDITKKDLYDSVKQLVETDIQHIHLNQHKLFTLYSIAFQYMLFRSTKVPGAYIIRIEDSMLTEKIAKRAKDISSRRFLQTLLLPRRYKYNRSTFFLDFFNIGTWAKTSEIPQNKIKGAIIVKNTVVKPMNTTNTNSLIENPLEIEDINKLKESSDDIDQHEIVIDNIPPNYFHTSLRQIAPKTIIISYEEQFENTDIITFPFITPKIETESLDGVTISKKLNLSQIN